MNFDPTAMKRLMSLDDRALWEQICTIARGAGITLSSTPPPHAELEKLRQMMGGCGQADVATAMQTIARYREGGQK